MPHLIRSLYMDICKIITLMQQGIYRRREPVAKQPVAAAVVEDDDDGEAFTY